MTTNPRQLINQKLDSQNVRNLPQKGFAQFPKSHHQVMTEASVGSPFWSLGLSSFEEAIITMAANIFHADDHCFTGASDSYVDFPLTSSIHLAFAIYLRWVHGSLRILDFGSGKNGVRE